MNEVVQGRGGRRAGGRRGGFRKASVLALIALGVFHVGDDAGNRRRSEAS